MKEEDKNIIQKSATDELFNYLDELFERSCRIAEEAEDTLEKICLPENNTQSTGVECCLREYPPFHTDIRERLNGIESSLFRIMRMLDRIDI